MKQSAKKTWNRLTDLLVEDILAASDEEILVETIEDHDNPEKIAKEMRTMFQKAILKTRKNQLTEL